MVMVVNPEPIKRIFTSYPFPSLLHNSSLWHRGWLFEALICDEGCYYQLSMFDWQLLSVQRFPEKAVAPNPSPASCHWGWRLVSPQICHLISLGRAGTCFSHNQPAELRGVSVEGLYTFGPCNWSGSGIDGRYFFQLDKDMWIKTLFRI